MKRTLPIVYAMGLAMDWRMNVGKRFGDIVMMCFILSKISRSPVFDGLEKKLNIERFF